MTTTSTIKPPSREQQLLAIIRHAELLHEAAAFGDAGSILAELLPGSERLPTATLTEELEFWAASFADTFPRLRKVEEDLSSGALVNEVLITQAAVSARIVVDSIRRRVEHLASSL